MSDELDVQVAREHVRQGEAWLMRAGASARGTLQRANYEAAIATAHFSAAMAITNVLLADPTETPEPVEL